MQYAIFYSFYTQSQIECCVNILNSLLIYLSSTLISFHRKPKKRKITPEHTKNALSSDSGAETETDNSDVEEKYEVEMAERPAKKLRPLLPIKTKDGILERSEECEGK